MPPSLCLVPRLDTHDLPCFHCYHHAAPQGMPLEFKAHRGCHDRSTIGTIVFQSSQYLLPTKIDPLL